MLFYAVFLLVFFRPGMAAPPADLDYQKVFEEIDPDIILDNERLLNSYLRCFYSEGACNMHQQAVKDHISITLSTVCGDCSEKQKEIFKYSLNKFIPKHPDDWTKILSIYDPTGEYWPNVKIFLET